MHEVKGDLWSYYGRKGFFICVTTNGFVKNDGTGVMGAGTALQAAKLVPDLPRLLGASLKVRGNHVSQLTLNILSFPVKRVWMEDASVKLIKRSVAELKERALKHPGLKFILPKPGCGNGHLSWKKVKPLVEGLPDNVFVIDKE